MISMNVLVLKTLIGTKIGVKTLTVLEDKRGTEVSASVLEDYSLMELFVCNVLMDKFGMQEEKLVGVKQVIDGMETSAKRFIVVQEDVFIMKHFNNVFVNKENFGMDLLVWSSLIVVVERNGILKNSNVNVLQALTGMDNLVFNVSMEKFGINQQVPVFVLLELNGMDIFAL